MQIVINIPEDVYKRTVFYREFRDLSDCVATIKALEKATQLPKGHGFIAICDSDFPITEEVKQELKNTVFVGNEDCSYCFDITEIIEADKAESEG